jgi:hypothetical protein
MYSAEGFSEIMFEFLRAGSKEDIFMLGYVVT